MDWSGAEAGQRKSIPVDCEVIRVLLTWTRCRGRAKECKIARKDIKVLFGSFVMYCLFFFFLVLYIIRNENNGLTSRRR